MTWRVGKKLGRTLYDGETLVGLMDTQELAASVVTAVNGAELPSEILDTAPVPPAKDAPESERKLYEAWRAAAGEALKAQTRAENAERWKSLAEIAERTVETKEHLLALAEKRLENVTHECAEWKRRHDILEAFGRKAMQALCLQEGEPEIAEAKAEGERLGLDSE